MFAVLQCCVIAVTKLCFYFLGMKMMQKSRYKIIAAAFIIKILFIYLPCSFAQLSFSEAVRLNTNFSEVESKSTLK
jgi:hypothetical protein